MGDAGDAEEQRRQRRRQHPAAVVDAPAADPAEETVRSFDVSEEMGILLLTSENHVLYWDQAGNMTAAFSFHTSGTAGIAWDHDLICLFLTRGNLVLKFSVDGEMREVLRLEHLDYTTQKSWDAQAYREEKEVSSGTYTLLRRSGLAAAIHEHEYLKLVFLEKATGKETTLYDVSRQVFIKDLLLLVLAAALIVVLLLIVIGYRKKKKSEAGAGDSDTCQ